MKQITFFDPRCTDAEHPEGQQLTVTATTADEYAANMAAILDPARGITLISEEDLPDPIDPADQLRADVDYLLIMGGLA